MSTELKKINKKIDDAMEVVSQITASDELYQIQLNEAIWTSGPQRFAQIPEWSRLGLVRPLTKQGLERTLDNKLTRKLSPFRFDKKEQKLKPFKNLTIFPSIDPYDPSLRALLRILMEENPWILEGIEILQRLIVSESTRQLVPRTEEDLPEDSLELWKQNTLIYVPYFKKKVSPKVLESWLDNYFKKLDFDSLLFDAFAFLAEQGRTCIGMFPAERKANGKLPLPQALKLIRPELLRRPIVDYDTGELKGVEVSNYTGNGALLDAKRCIYMNLSKNLQLFGDFYGKSMIRSLADVGKVQLQIYGIDWLQAAISTWHTSPIFKHTMPSKDWSVIKQKMDDFNAAMEGAMNKIVSISNNVELLNPNGTDSGDIMGLNDIEQRSFEVIAGKLGIPLYMYSRGKQGNLGGNANREEIEAFLNGKIKPMQDLLEKIAEDQAYDRVLAILWEVEPEQVSNVPVKLLHRFEKPNISTPITKDEWEVMMTLLANNKTTWEQVMEHFGLRNMMVDSPTLGTDTTPAVKTFNPGARINHPTWDNQRPSGPVNNPPITQGVMNSPDQSINELTQHKMQLLKQISEKVKQDTQNARMKKKLEQEHKLKMRQMESKFTKDKTTWEAKREKEFLASKKK